MIFEQRAEEKEGGSFVDIGGRSFQAGGAAGAKALRRKCAVSVPEHQGGWHSWSDLVEEWWEMNVSSIELLLLVCLLSCQGLFQSFLAGLPVQLAPIPSGL